MNQESTFSQHQPGHPGSSKNRAGLIIIFLVFCSIFSAQAILSLIQKSQTIDEAMHLTKGYVQWKYRDFRMEPQNPPLVSMLSALPILFMNVSFPKELVLAQERPDDYEIADQFFYHSGNDADTLLFWGRLPVVFLGMLLGWYVLQWSYELHGLKGAILALTLYAFSPNILAHTRLITTDIAVTSFIFISIYYFHHYLKHPAASNLIKTGAALGLALASKFTSLFLLPLLVLAAVADYWQKNSFVRKKYGVFVRDLAVIVLIGGITLWSFYFFKVETVGTLYDLDNHHSTVVRIADSIHMDPAKIEKVLKYIPSPGTYLKGLGNVISDGFRAQPLFFMGERSETGWKTYHIAAFLIKTPIPTLTLFMLILLLFHRYPVHARFLLLPVLFFFALSIAGRFADKGLRHILPVYPFLFVLIPGILNLSIHKTSQRIINFAVLPLLIWYVFASIRTFPDYIPHYNEFIGGPKNGYKYLIDSNTDWGQDLKKLKVYMDSNHIDKVKLAYFGSANPDYYHINYEYLWSHNRIKKPDDYRRTILPGKGIYAVSATSLQTIGYWTGEGYVDNPEYSFQWLNQYQPVAIVGNSILIYNIE